MRLARLAAVARGVLKDSTTLKGLIGGAAVAYGINTLQTLATEVQERTQAARADHAILTNHAELLQARISDLEASAIESVRAAIASGLYDDEVRVRAYKLQELDDADRIAGRVPDGPIELVADGPIVIGDAAALDECGQPFPCAHRAGDPTVNHPVTAVS